jgi:glyoxylase-like metal-dependent hydrolase (beta-lactamase superfamily II)
MKIEGFYDQRSATITYVGWDEDTRDAFVIDPVLDYESTGSKVFTESADRVIAFLKSKKLALHLILETHAHADHLSGAQTLKAEFPDAKVGISKRITQVQRIFHEALNLGDDVATDGSQFDVLFEDNATLRAGSLALKAIPTPGHTPACSSYLIEDILFTGDALFMPDVGTGRCDFPAGSASDLYDSVHESLYSLDDSTRVLVGHDYPPASRAVQFESTLGAEKARNIQITSLTQKNAYIAMREARDKTLAAPRLLYQSIQVNIDAGHLPKPSANEKRFLQIPLNT